MRGGEETGGNPRSDRGLRADAQRGYSEDAEHEERRVDAAGDGVMRVGPADREVHCGEAQGRTKNEKEELATWAAKEVYDCLV